MQPNVPHSAGPQAGSASVAALWRYPVKSMLGEELNAAEVTVRGLLGDRQFAVVDAASPRLGSTLPVRSRCRPSTVRKSPAIKVMLAA